MSETTPLDPAVAGAIEGTVAPEPCDIIVPLEAVEVALIEMAQERYTGEKRQVDNRYAASLAPVIQAARQRGGLSEAAGCKIQKDAAGAWNLTFTDVPTDTE